MTPRGGNGGCEAPSISPSTPFATHLADRGISAAVRTLWAVGCEGFAEGWTGFWGGSGGQESEGRGLFG